MCFCQLSVKCISVEVMQSHRDEGMQGCRDGAVARWLSGESNRLPSFKFQEGMDMLIQCSFLTHGPLDQERQPQHRDHPTLIE